MKLSVVLAARNDDYGGGFQDRLRICVSHLVAYFERVNLDAEIVIVEWNPIDDQPSLATQLSTIHANGRVRIVRVDGAIHRVMPGSDQSPLFEYRAKNVGIRRAKGDFILTINPDIIFSAQLHAFLASDGLSKGAYYRVDRFDLPSGDLSALSSSQLEDWCETNWAEVVVYWGTVSRRDWFRRGLNHGANLVLPLRGGGTAHPHMNASGDFMLMHRDDWWSTRGYREITAFAHLDSLMIYAALSHGLTQKVLRGKRRIYHQFHGRREQSARVTPGHAEIVASGRKALAERRPLVENSETWGLSAYSFPEIVV